jgi:phosphate transport system protein
MLQQTLDAFARMDPDTARVIIESDKVIDQSYKVLTHKMERVMEDSCEVISQALDMIWCGRALERIGDHCKNICEQIIFFVEGQDIRYQKNRDRH